MKKEYIKIVTNCPIFSEIDSENLESILSCINPKIMQFKKNEYIGLAGEKIYGIGFVLEGSVIITKDNISGNRLVMGIMEVGDMFGEMVAFSSQDVWPANIMAQEESTVMFIPPNKIVGVCEKVCQSHKMLTNNMLKIISQKALMLNKKLEYLAIKSMRGKICTYLLELYKNTGSDIFIMPLNRNELADFLNVSRPSMSREMSRMSEEGLIEFYKSSIKLKNIEKIFEYID